MEKVYQGESTLVSKLNYHHDWTDADSWGLTLTDTRRPTASEFYVGRANVTGIRRYNLSAPDDDNQAIWIKDWL